MFCLEDGICKQEFRKELDDLSLAKAVEKLTSARQEERRQELQLQLGGNLVAPNMPTLETAPCFLLIDEDCEVCRMLNLDQSWIKFKDWLAQCGIPILSMRVIEELNLARFKKLLEKHRVIERVLDWRTFEIRETYNTPVLVCEDIAYEFKIELPKQDKDRDKPPLTRFIENRYVLVKIKDMVRIAKAIVRYHCEKYGGCSRFVYSHREEGKGRSRKRKTKREEFLEEVRHGLGLLKNLEK
jgi:hypothetical protein